jgi:TolB-like protein/Flp pilus assembly protein TadD
MQIWSSEIKEIERLYDSVKSQSPELEKELERLIRTDDENIVLVYSRRCLEVIVTDLCENELKRPRKTEPLQGIIDKLNREEKIPSHIFASMQSLNSLSTFGSHPKDFDPEQVKPVLNNLAIIIRWYLKYLETRTGQEESSGTNHEIIKQEIKESVGTKTGINKLKTRSILLLSGLVIIAAVVILVVLLLPGRNKKAQELEKSIAVLPFINDSPNDSTTYFINGIMDEVLINLQKIKELRVISRTSVEKYRGSSLQSIPEIARELGVNYIVEGSGQKYGDNIRLRVQLIRADKESHLWGEPYERKIKQVNDILDIQGQIAQSIAEELKAVITPEEKELIEKVPTSNLTAYDFYQKANEEQAKYLNSNYGMIPDNDEMKSCMIRAKALYHEALRYDPAFARAYSGLARVYANMITFEDYLSESYGDSVLILTNIALSYDDRLADAYSQRGTYYYFMGKVEQALEEVEKAIKYNPNDWMAYNIKGTLYSWTDYIIALDNLLKAASLNHGLEFPSLLKQIRDGYYEAGFIEKGNYYGKEALKLDGDSLSYYNALSKAENFQANYKKAVEFAQKVFFLDSNDAEVQYNLGYNYMFLGQYKESLKYFQKIEKANSGVLLNNMQRIGYLYWQNGDRKKAQYYFDKQIEYCQRQIELNRPNALNYLTYYDLAGVYAFLSEKDKAFENLRKFSQMQVVPLWLLTLLKNDPLFESIRNEPEFQQIVRNAESKYQAEHERVRKWLEDRGEI